MIELASIKAFLEVTKEAIAIATGSKQASEEKFDKTLGAMFSELDVVVQSYFGLFTELRTLVRKSRTSKALNDALDHIATKRDSIVVNRNKIAGSLDAYEEVLVSKGIDCRPINSTGNYFLMFLSDIDAFFYEPFAHGTSQFSVLFEELESVRRDSQDFSSAKERCLHSIKESIDDLERFWKSACKNFEMLRMNKKKVLKLLQ